MIHFTISLTDERTSNKGSELFLWCLYCCVFSNKHIPMTAQAAPQRCLCYSYSESLYVTMAAVMEGDRETKMTGTSPLKYNLAHPIRG